MPNPHKILPFVEPIETEVVDDPAHLETEIINNLSPEPKGSPLSLPRLGWALARQGLLWRQDTASWMLLALRDGRIVTEHPTELDVRRDATLFLADRFAGEPALGVLMKADAIYGVTNLVPKILQQAKLFSMAGRPGENHAEEFVRRYVTDRIENGVDKGRAVPRYESVTSAALKALYEKIKRNNPLKDRPLEVALKAAMTVVFPGNPQVGCILSAKGTEVRGWKGLRIRTD
jgi:hypothetical protein